MIPTFIFMLSLCLNWPHPLYFLLIKFSWIQFNSIWEHYLQDKDLLYVHCIRKKKLFLNSILILNVSTSSECDLNLLWHWHVNTFQELQIGVIILCCLITTDQRLLSHCSTVCHIGIWYIIIIIKTKIDSEGVSLLHRGACRYIRRHWTEPCPQFCF